MVAAHLPVSARCAPEAAAPSTAPMPGPGEPHSCSRARAQNEHNPARQSEAAALFEHICELAAIRQPVRRTLNGYSRS